MNSETDAKLTGRAASTPTHAAHADRIALVVLIGFLLSIGVHYWLSHYQGLPYPHSTYLCRPGDEFGVVSEATRVHGFGDLLAPYLHAADRDPYFTTLPDTLERPRPFPSNYPPLVSALMLPLTKLPYPWLVWLYLTSAIAAFLWFGATEFAGVDRTATWRNAVTLTLLTYPVQFALDRGNIEILAFVLVALFAKNHRQGDDKRASIFLAVAIALKIFPAAFLIVYLRPFRPKVLAQTLGLAALLTALSYLVLKRPVSENALQFAKNLLAYESTSFNEGVMSARYSSSIKAMLDVLAATTTGALAQAAETLKTLPVGPILALAIVWKAARTDLPRWGLLAFAAALMTAVPTVAADYRLIYWLVPVAAFIQDANSSRTDRIAAILFGLLLIPKGLVIVGEVRLGTVLNPVLMLALLLVVSFHGKPAGGPSNSQRKPAHVPPLHGG